MRSYTGHVLPPSLRPLTSPVRSRAIRHRPTFPHRPTHAAVHTHLCVPTCDWDLSNKQGARFGSTTARWKPKLSALGWPTKPRGDPPDGNDRGTEHNQDPA